MFVFQIGTKVGEDEKPKKRQPIGTKVDEEKKGADSKSQTQDQGFTGPLKVIEKFREKVAEAKKKKEKEKESTVTVEIGWYDDKKVFHKGEYPGTKEDEKKEEDNDDYYKGLPVVTVKEVKAARRKELESQKADIQKKLNVINVNFKNVTNLYRLDKITEKMYADIYTAKLDLESKLKTINAELGELGSGTVTTTKTSRKTNKKTSIKYHKVGREAGYDPNALSGSLSGNDYLKQFDPVFHLIYGKFDRHDPTGDVSVKGYTASKEDAEKKFKEAEAIMKGLKWDTASMDSDKAKVFLEIVRRLAKGEKAEEITESYKGVSLKDASASVTSGISVYVEAFGGNLSSMALAPVTEEEGEEKKEAKKEEEVMVPRVWAMIEDDTFLSKVWNILTDKQKEEVEVSFGKEDENLHDDQISNRMDLLIEDQDGNLIPSKAILADKIGIITGYYHPLKRNDSIMKNPRVQERLAGYDEKDRNNLLEQGKIVKNGEEFFSVETFLKMVPEKKEETKGTYSDLAKLMDENKSLKDKYYTRNSQDGDERGISERTELNDALNNEFRGKKFTAQEVIDFIVKYDGGVPVKKVTEEKKVSVLEKTYDNSIEGISTALSDLKKGKYISAIPEGAADSISLGMETKKPTGQQVLDAFGRYQKANETKIEAAKTFASLNDALKDPVIEQRAMEQGVFDENGAIKSGAEAYINKAVKGTAKKQENYLQAISDWNKSVENGSPVNNDGKTITPGVTNSLYKGELSGKVDWADKLLVNSYKEVRDNCVSLGMPEAKVDQAISDFTVYLAGNDGETTRALMNGNVSKTSAFLSELVQAYYSQL